MLVLRCTQKLLKKNPGPANGREDELVPTLGNWHANLIRLAHSPVVLCVNDLTLLAILVPGRNLPTFVPEFQNRLAQRLCRMKLPYETISDELAATEIVHIQPTNNRSVLASMNDFVRHLKGMVSNQFDFSQANAFEDLLSGIPMGALKYLLPVEAAATAFKQL